MKAITISQPHASRIARGEKFVENRSQPWHYRGRIAIHAGLGTQYLTRRERLSMHLPGGAIIAVAELQTCVSLEFIRHQCRSGLERQGDLITGTDHTWIEVRNHIHTEGPYCLVLGHVLTLPVPIPCKGALGLWTVPSDIEAEIESLCLGTV